MFGVVCVVSVILFFCGFMYSSKRARVRELGDARALAHAASWLRIFECVRCVRMPVCRVVYMYVPTKTEAKRACINIYIYIQTHKRNYKRACVCKPTHKTTEPKTYAGTHT